MLILRFNLLDEEDIQLWKCLPQQGDWYLKWQNQITNLSFVSTKCPYDNSYSLLPHIFCMLVKRIWLYCTSKYGQALCFQAILSSTAKASLYSQWFLDEGPTCKSLLHTFSFYSYPLTMITITINPDCYKKKTFFNLSVPTNFSFLSLAKWGSFHDFIHLERKTA